MTYTQGVEDCANGVKHRDGNGEEYDRGYAEQYNNEQIAGERTK